MKCYLLTAGYRDDEYPVKVFSTLEKAQSHMVDVMNELNKYPWEVNNWSGGRWAYTQVTNPDPYYAAQEQYEIYELDYE
jgi:hypothetical protein